MKRKLVDIVAIVFMVCTGLLTVLSLLSIWKFVSSDVLMKSMATVGIVAFASVITMVASRSMGGADTSEAPQSAELTAFFSILRSITSAVLIVSVVMLTLIGVLAIWDVISDKTFLSRVISSMLVLAFSSFITIFACADREGKTIFGKTKELESKSMSGGSMLVLLLIVAYGVMAFSRMLFY